MVRRAFRIGMSIVLMVALVAVFLWNTDLSKVGQSLSSARPGWILLSCLLALLSYWLRALRWMMILRPVGKVSHRGAVLSTAVGYAAIALLPARLGDLVRPLVLARAEKLPLPATLASILTERLFDLWAVLAFFFVFLSWPPPMAMQSEPGSSPLHAMTLTGYAVGAGLLLITIVLLALFQFQERFIAIATIPVARFKPKWEGPAKKLLEHFLAGIKIIHRPRDLVTVAAASIAVWLVVYLQVMACLTAFGFSLPFRATFLLVVLSVLGLAVPTPGGVGGFHAGNQFGLTQFFGVPLDAATGFAIVTHAISFIPITLLGLFSLPALGLSLKDMGTLTTTREAPGEPNS